MGCAWLGGAGCMALLAATTPRLVPSPSPPPPAPPPPPPAHLHPGLVVEVGDVELAAGGVGQHLVVLLENLVEAHVVLKGAETTVKRKKAGEVWRHKSICSGSTGQPGGRQASSPLPPASPTTRPHLTRLTYFSSCRNSSPMALASCTQQHHSLLSALINC